MKLNKIIIAIITSLLLITSAFAENSEKEPIKIFQQYKQETVYPINNNNNYSIYNYNMYFSPHYNPRYNNHQRTYMVMHPMYYSPFYAMNNYKFDDNANFYLKHMPKDTYVDENEYNIFNKKSED